MVKLRKSGAAGLRDCSCRKSGAGLVDRVTREIVTIAGLMCAGLRDHAPVHQNFVILCFYLPFKVLFNVLMLSFFYICSLFDLMMLLYTK